MVALLTPGSRRAIRAASCLCLIVFGAVAHAHDADIVYVSFQRVGSRGVSERVTMTGPTLRRLTGEEPSAEWNQPALEASARAIASGVWERAPVLAPGGSCSRSEETATLRSGYVELAARFDCSAAPRKQDMRFLSDLPGRYKVVLEDVTVGEAGAQRFAQGAESSIELPGAGERSALVQLGGWVGLGVFHILSGFDHLAFLLALLLVCETWKRVLAMVTSFTVAHSITLGATVLNLIVLSERQQRWTEAAIAVSIMFVAAENLLRRRHTHRAWITFGFGLVHGFGFASALKSYGLGNSVALELLGFNSGVEVGQAAVVVLVYPWLRVLQRRERAGWILRAGSLAVLVAGAFWLVDRLQP